MAAGVLFGQQVLKDPFRRLVSSEVVVRGTYDDPEVVVVGTASALAAASEDVHTRRRGTGSDEADAADTSQDRREE